MAEKAKWILEVDTKKGTANLKKFGSSQDQVTKRMKQQGTQATKLKSSLGSLQGAILRIAGGVGLALITRQFLKAADTAEQYQVRLGVLLRSTKEGARLFKEMADYAGKVPFQYENVMGAATTLAGVMRGGVDEIKEWMPLIGDLAAASGLSIELATGQVVRMLSAGAGAARLFRQRGLLNMLGFSDGVRRSAEETRAQLMRSWQKTDSQFRGATEKLAVTWKGTTSMMADKWFKFRIMVMDSGPFRALKLMIGTVNKEFDKLVESGQMDKIAESVGGTVLSIFKTLLIGTAGLIDNIAIPIGSLIGDMVKGFKALPPWLQEIGIMGALLFGWKGKLTLAALTFITNKMDEYIDKETTVVSQFEKAKKDMEFFREEYKRLLELEGQGVDIGGRGRGGAGDWKEEITAQVVAQEKRILNFKKKLATLYPEGAGKEFVGLLKETGEAIVDVKKDFGDFSLLKAFAGIQGGKSPAMKIATDIIKQLEGAIKVVTAGISGASGMQLDLSVLRADFLDQAKALAGDAEAIRRVAMAKELDEVEEKYGNLALSAVNAGVIGMNFEEQKGLALSGIRKKYADKELMEKEKEEQEKLSIDQRYDEAIILSKGQASEIRKEARKNELEMVKYHYTEMTNAMLEHGYSEIEVTAFIEAQKAMLKEKYRREDLQRDQDLTQSRLGILESAAGKFTSLYRDMAQAGLIESKKSFGIYQALAMAEAGISTASGVMKALNESSLPFPANAIWAGIVGTMGAAQMALIMSEKPPSYDLGGVSRTPGYYYSGVEEAHIPLKGGSVPVSLGDGKGSRSSAGGVTIQLNNPVFQDIETMQMYMQEVARMAVEFGAPGAVLADYQNNGMIRDLIRGGY